MVYQTKMGETVKHVISVHCWKNGWKRGCSHALGQPTNTLTFGSQWLQWKPFSPQGQQIGTHVLFFRAFSPRGGTWASRCYLKKFTTIEMNMDEHWKSRTWLLFSIPGTSFFSLKLFSDLPKSRYSITNNKSSWSDTRIPIQISTKVPSIYEAFVGNLNIPGLLAKVHSFHT